MNRDLRSIIAGNHLALPQIWKCPACRRGMVKEDDETLQCVHCGKVFIRHDGIWNFLRESEVTETFVLRYDDLRRDEGWGSEDPRCYLKLPYEDLTGRHTRIWRLRSRNWELFIRKVLIPMEQDRLRPLCIFDLGSGNGWASWQIARRGHRVWAVDIRKNEWDGLQASRHYPVSFVKVLADMDHLPFRDRTADLVLYNASLHYSPNYRETLAEGIRVLAGDGRLVVLDTPWYSSEREGRKMMEENHSRYSRMYSTAFPISAFQGFLTEERLQEMTAGLTVAVSAYRTRRLLKDQLRRTGRRLRRLREAASFPMLVFRHATSYPVPEDFIDSQIRNRAIFRLVYLAALKVHQWFSARFRYGRAHAERAGGRRFWVTDETFPPRLMRSGAWMADVLNEMPALIPRQGNVLDLGTGSGILAVTASKYASYVVGVDNNPEAVKCARRNAERFGCRNVWFLEGNLFDPVWKERFDCILCNPPWFRGKPENPLDGAWRSESFQDELADELHGHLSLNGYALLVLSDRGVSEWLLDRFWYLGYRIKAVTHRDYVNEVLVLYKISRVQS